MIVLFYPVLIVVVAGLIVVAGLMVVADLMVEGLVWELKSGFVGPE